jgi:hypothetical protein
MALAEQGSGHQSTQLQWLMLQVQQRNSWTKVAIAEASSNLQSHGMYYC